MKFALIKNGDNPARDQIAEELVQTCLAHGHELGSPENGVKFVLNLTDTESPRIYRRRAQSVIVFSLVTANAPPEELRSLCYTTLVRSLSNVVLCAVPRYGSAGNGGGPAYEMYFTTPEAGFYHLGYGADQIFERMIPIAGARFAIQNRISADLPQAYWETSPVVEDIRRSAGKLDSLGVLPLPFPLHELLSEDSIRHIFLIFGMKGLSYGNMSARERIPELGGQTYWMTARGVNKAKVTKIGQDILLVRGLDDDTKEILVSVPPDHDPKARVSVDAVEHELIYRTFPEVGAIVHVHAWIDGVVCTRQNYPCGTIELAEEVVHMLKQTDCPGRTAVGLKNHGLTITGPCLDEIFGRIQGRLRTEVQMMA